MTTPAELIRDRVQAAVADDDGRLVVTAPPQEALKTSLAVEVVREAAAQGLRVIYASYLEQVARNHTRDIVGTVHPVAVGGGLGGRAADLLAVDDPISNPQPPASAVERACAWLDSAALCRLAPGGSAVMFATRTGPRDVTAYLAGRGWPVLNVPVLADGHAPDALGREPGTWLASLRGRTSVEWDRHRALVTHRLWQTLFQGDPPADDVEEAA